jgi:Domain of unknown function (DUF5666)
MKRMLASMLSLACMTLALTLGAFGQEQSQAPAGQEGNPPPRRGMMMQGMERVYGTVASVGVESFIIKKDDGSTVTVMVNDQTRYRDGQKDMQLEDLKVGDPVVAAGPKADKDFTAAFVRKSMPGQMMGLMGARNGAFGQIVSIDGNTIKLHSERMGDRTILVNDQTTYFKEGQPSSLKDFKVGDRVFAQGAESNGQFVATRMNSGFMHGQGGWRGRRNPSEDQPQGGPPQQ